MNDPDNKKKRAKSLHNYFQVHKKELTKYAIDWQKKHPRKDIKYRLNHVMAKTIGRALNGKKSGRTWVSLVGYTQKKLMQHLEKLFVEGMSWDNYGEWHIDHIIPISVFNYSDVTHTDFKKCWALENLQPMWAGDNIRKSNKLFKPFQPSLGF